MLRRLPIPGSKFTTRRFRRILRPTEVVLGQDLLPHLKE